MKQRQILNFLFGFIVLSSTSARLLKNYGRVTPPSLAIVESNSGMETKQSTNENRERKLSMLQDPSTPMEVFMKTDDFKPTVAKKNLKPNVIYIIIKADLIFIFESKEIDYF